MKIVKATKQAMLVGKGITRKNELWKNITLIPTNTDCCIIVVNGNKSSAIRWQPSADDLIAEDWIVTK